jgi:hypothetical protein
VEAVDRRVDVNHQPAAVLLCQQSPRQRERVDERYQRDGTANLKAPPGARGRVNASAGGTDRAYSTRRGFPWRLPEHRR